MNKKYLNLYLDFLRKFANIKKSLSVVVDCSNGPAGIIINDLNIEKLRLITINDEPNGDFPAHGPDPTKEGVEEDVSKKIIKTGSDFGVVLDGDGDRAVFIDNTGNKLAAHTIAQILFSSHQPPFVTDILVHRLLKYSDYSDIENIKISKVGTKFAKKTMSETSSSVGVEISGHCYFRSKVNEKIINIDSGVLAVIKIANTLSKMNISLDKFSKSIPYSNYETINIPTNKDIVKKIKNELKNKIIAENTLDGATFDFSDWWLNIRKSNTEPVSRVTIGTNKKGALNNKKMRIMKIIKT